MSDAVLYTMLAFLAVALWAVLLALAAGILDQAQERRLRPRVERAHRATVAAVSLGSTAGDRTTPESTTEAVQALGELPFEAAVDVLLDLAHSVGGSSQAILASIADEVGLLDQARQDLHGRRWWRRLHAVRLLRAVGPESSDYLPLLDDRSPEVRAEAAAWAVNQPTPEATQRLAEMVSDDDGLCRFAARSALVDIGLPALNEIGRLLSSDDDEVTARTLPIAAAVGDPSLTAHLVPLTKSESDSIRAGSATALGRTGDTGAAEVLTGMLADESPPVRRAAVTALARLGAWPAAADIEWLLADDVADVRRDAGKALGRVGEVGEVLLRSSARGVGISATAARHALEMRSLGVEGATT